MVKFEPLTGIKRVFEAGLVMTTVLTLMMMFALGSFHANDPGWSQTPVQETIHNYMGTLGAWFADVLFFIFGLTAFAVPPTIAALGWLVFHQVHRLSNIDYFSSGLRVLGFFMLFLGFSGLVAMNADDIYTFPAGGVIGNILVTFCYPYLNLGGTTLLFIAAILAGFTLMTGISLLTIIDGVGYYVILGAKKAYRSLFSRSDDVAASEDTQLYMQLIKRFKHNKQMKETAPSEPVIKTDPTVAADLDQQDKPHNVVPKIAKDTPTLPKVEPKLSKIEPKLSKEEPILSKEEPKLPSLSSKEEPIRSSVQSELAPIKDVLPDIIESKSDEASALAPWHSDDVVSSDGATIAPENTSVPQGAIEKGVLASASTTVTPMPTLSLLDIPPERKNNISQQELDEVSRLVEAKLADFNIVAEVVEVHPGPVITRFELDLAPGVKVSKISNLSKDLARALSAVSVRVVEVIPGKSLIGIELPNSIRETVFMRNVLDCEQFEQAQSPLSMVLGQDISGFPIVVDLAKMPHLLVAGTTGSGKSVGVNVMILSLLYKSTPEDVRMIMIDPKMLELSVYEGIPHLLCEVVTDMKEASNALRWCVGEMERRYKLMSALGVRNLKGYNQKILKAQQAGQPIRDPLWQAEQSMETQPPELEKLPSIVVVVDEFADMMMIVGKKVEELIARIAQKARAAGIHLILATQRPSVDVITGLIKANIPTRIAFQVSSRIDSRTILDQQGAEQLLGMGDMLYLPPGSGVPIRVHGAFVDDHEVHNVVADWAKRAKPEYIDEILSGESAGDMVLLPGETKDDDTENDPFYDEAVAFVIETRRASISSVQRKFKVGYNRAARLVEQMEQAGIVSAQGHNGNREVLVPGGAGR